jgi:hypothetical protein
MSIELNNKINELFLENESDLESENSSDYSDSDLSDDEKDSEVLLKKKRGRKPKPKEENINIEKVQKRRGRKPKPKDLLEEDKVPKKRGRKPKEKIYSVKELPKTFFEENKNETLILHLPIKPSDNILDNNPVPNKMGIDYSSYENDLDNSYLLPTQTNLIKNITDKFLFDNENNDDTFFNKKEIIEEKVIENNENENENDVKQNKIIKKNLRNILYEFINANNDKVWPESTNINCWWCCHQFTNTPCSLPEYYKKDKFYVSGCFCSFNCTASYNFNRNDDNMWERFSLLNLMYKKLYNTKFVKISLAPPRETLKMFGGYLSIEEFRENLLRTDKTFSVVKPPLVSIIPKIEENKSNTVRNIKTNYPLINESILNKTHNNLKLKRNKPITNVNNTLQSFMDLKII